MNYLTLISYTLTWTAREESPSDQDGIWLRSLGELTAQIGPSNYSVLSTLTLLSNSLLSGQSLPPYIPLPRPYELTRRLLHLIEAERESEEADSGPAEPRAVAGAGAQPALLGLSNILDTSNVEQRGYSEFAVLQMCSTLICDDLEGLVRDVTTLVGTVDFSFRVDISDSSLDTFGPETGAAGNDPPRPKMD